MPRISVDMITTVFLSQWFSVPEEVLDLGKSVTEIAPRLRVLPVVFSWAFHLAHVAHE